MKDIFDVRLQICQAQDSVSRLAEAAAPSEALLLKPPPRGFLDSDYSQGPLDINHRARLKDKTPARSE